MPAAAETGGYSPEQGALVIKQERLSNINSIVDRHNLARPYTLEGLGDLDRGETEITGVGEVLKLGDEGLHLVQLPAQFTKDTPDKPGVRGAFWTFFGKKGSIFDRSIVVPFAKDIPGNFEQPQGVPHLNPNVERVNRELAELHVRPIYPNVSAPQEDILGIEDVVKNNERFFTVVVFKVRTQEGEGALRPFVFNANSDSNMDGAVFSPIVRAENVGFEPRIMIGDTYRPNYGGWNREVPRGFYSPRLGGERNGFQVRQFTDVPTLRRAVEEVTDETGLISANNLKESGRIMADPTFEASAPHFFNIDVDSPEFQPQDLEASEKIRLKFITAGEYFQGIREIKDPYTITAVSRDLLSRGALRLSKRGIEAQNEGERILLERHYRPQFGWTVEATRSSSLDGLDKVISDGDLPINTGIARILPELYHGDTTWNKYKEGKTDSQLSTAHAVFPYEALRDITYGKYDLVTTAAVIKSLHAKGYITLNLANLY